MDGETLAQLFEEDQVQWDSTQGVKHTKHLTGYSAGGEVAIACGQGNGLSLLLSNRNVEMLLMLKRSSPIVVTTVPAKKKELLKSQLLGFVELPEGFTPFSQASKITCGQQRVLAP